jgi:hypothetical protein
MIARGEGGRIVNISTIGAHAVHKDAAVYDSAKGAVEVMTRNLPMSWRRSASASIASSPALSPSVPVPSRAPRYGPAPYATSRPAGLAGRKISPPRCASSACQRPSSPPGSRCWSTAATVSTCMSDAFGNGTPPGCGPATRRNTWPYSGSANCPVLTNTGSAVRTEVLASSRRLCMASLLNPSRSRTRATRRSIAAW